jgi:transcription initiation factor TFIIIB Brf1 subunit/transcription initiation factor TFIIB
MNDTSDTDHEHVYHEQSGHITCTECGLVRQDVVYDASAQCFDLCGPSNDNELNPYMGISTWTSKGSRSLITKNGSLVQKDIYSLHIQNSYSYKQRSYDTMGSGIDNYNYSNGVKTMAKTLFLEIMKTGQVYKGSNRKGLVACSMYYACIKYNCPRCPKELCSEFKIDTSVFSRSDKIFRSVIKNTEYAYLLDIVNDAKGYLLRHCSILEMNGLIGNYYAFYNKCVQVHDNLGPMYTGPKSISCAIIYVVGAPERGRTALRAHCESKLTKTTLIKLFDVSYPTLNKIINDILKNNIALDT